MIDSKLYQEDLDIFSQNLDVSFFVNKNILITGASGLLGSSIVDVLCNSLIVNNQKANINVTARNIQQLQKQFDCYKTYHLIQQYYECDLRNIVNCIKDRFDIIIHCASLSDPNGFYNYSYDVLSTSAVSTSLMLDNNCIKGGTFVYISSCDVYSSIKKEDKYQENDILGINVDFSSSRLSYPFSKLLSEYLCILRNRQYNDINYLIFRPCHLFGPNFKLSDNKVNPYLLLACHNREDVTLNSNGLYCRSGMYSLEAAHAVLFSIAHTNNQIINLCNPQYDMSLREFAQIATKAVGVNIVYKNKEDSLISPSQKQISPHMLLSADFLINTLKWKSPLENVKSQ